MVIQITLSAIILVLVIVLVLKSKRSRTLLSEIKLLDKTNSEMHQAGISYLNQNEALRNDLKKITLSLQNKQKMIDNTSITMQAQKERIDELNNIINSTDMKNHEKLVKSLTAEAKFSLFRKIVNNTVDYTYLNNYALTLSQQINRYAVNEEDKKIIPKNDKPSRKYKSYKGRVDYSKANNSSATKELSQYHPDSM